MDKIAVLPLDSAPCFCDVELAAMLFAALIYVPANSDLEPGMHEEYAAFLAAASTAGVIKGGEELADESKAVTVSIHSGERVRKDGPFAENEQVLGGYFLFECASVDEAIDWAEKIPDARRGSIEIRPVVKR